MYLRMVLILNEIELFFDSLTGLRDAKFQGAPALKQLKINNIKFNVDLKIITNEKYILI